MQEIKNQIIDALEALRPELLEMSHDIHDHPELGFEEYHAISLIRAQLEKHHFAITDNFCGMETALKATFVGKGDGPHIAFLAEYDALPGVGHGCGHNVIATCAVGAAIGLSKVMDNFCGKVSLIATPAEESGGGKAIMVDKGGFDDVDFAMMIHPSTGRSLIGRGGRAAVIIGVEFEGKNAHSSRPERGINALSAVIHLFNTIDLVRPTLDMYDNINGVITHGGLASNIIPGFASCKFAVRANTMKELEHLSQIIQDAAASAEKITGAKAKVDVGPFYAERYPNLTMGEKFKENMALLGEEMELAKPGAYGSSDVGNVSIKLPAIHEYLSIGPSTVNAHSKELAACAISERADTVCIKGAQGLAMTGVDILSSQELRDAIKAEHEKSVPDFYKK